MTIKEKLLRKRESLVKELDEVDETLKVLDNDIVSKHIELMIDKPLKNSKPQTKPNTFQDLVKKVSEKSSVE